MQTLADRHIEGRERARSDAAGFRQAVARLEMADEKAIRSARVVIGAAAEKVTRLAATERLLSGAVPDEAMLKRASECAASEAKFVSDAHGSAPYKRELLWVYLARAIRKALA